MQLFPKKTNKKMETIRQSRDYTRLKKIKSPNYDSYETHAIADEDKSKPCSYPE